MSTIIEDYTPMSVGDTGVPFSPVFVHKDGTPVDLTNTTISMKIINDLGTVKTCSGTWTIDDATNGKAHYDWQSNDVNMDGDWQIYVVITNSLGPIHADTKPLTILQVP